MSINNSFSIERIKKALDIKTVAVVLLVVTLVSLCFYVTIDNLESREVLVWFITGDSNIGFSDETIRLINEYAAEKGIDRVLLTKRHPDDQYFDAAMSTSAYYNCDIFLMERELVSEYAEAGMFLPLSDNGMPEEKLLYDGTDTIGFLLKENYYFLVNAKTDIDSEIIYEIYNMLIDD